MAGAVFVVYFAARHASSFNAYCHTMADAMSGPSIMFKATLNDAARTNIIVDDYREAYWWAGPSPPLPSLSPSRVAGICAHAHAHDTLKKTIRVRKRGLGLEARSHFLFSSTRWLRDKTPKDARVMAWWDYGYQIRSVLGSWVGVRRLFHHSLFLTASRMVLPQDPSTDPNCALQRAQLVGAVLG